MLDHRAVFINRSGGLTLVVIRVERLKELAYAPRFAIAVAVPNPLVDAMGLSFGKTDIVAEFKKCHEKDSSVSLSFQHDEEFDGAEAFHRALKKKTRYFRVFVERT
jgi:hypothetical protein